MTEYVRPLSALGRGDLALAGGKAANLGELMRAGQSVPPGFCILTSAYAEFVYSNGLQARIEEHAQAVDAQSPASLEAASDRIRQLFEAATIPGGIVDAVRSAGAVLGVGTGVAVRSSATAEDLPDASFAGQQDTFLNVVGESGLMAAVLRCWASLWTARAIGYRLRSGIPHQEAALAVVVQLMVQGDVSGVLFTANPLTGDRRQTAIDATVGLGEALVAGKVEPDHYVVQAGTILSRSIGAKALSVRSRASGGTETIAEKGALRAALSDDEVRELEKRGREVEAHFGAPQDIEWTWANGKLFLLQARPITSLFPLPAGLPAGEPTVLLSLAQIQGMFDPFTPLGYDLFRLLAVGFGRIFGLHRTEDTQRGMFVAASRLWLNLTPPFRFRLGRRILANVFVPFIDPSLRPVVDRLLQDARLSGLRRMKARTRLGFIRILLPTFVGAARYLLDPAKARRRLFRSLDALAARVAAGHAQVRSVGERVRVIERMAGELPALFFGTLIPAVASGQASRQLLRSASSSLADRDARVMQVMRGLPFNVTTEMDLALWETARTIRTDAAAARRLLESSPIDLAREYLQGTLPGTAQAAMASFLERYGMRAVGEIDIGRPRWREDPASLFSALAAYLRIDDEHAVPDVVFERGAEAAEQAAEGLISALRAQPGGSRSARRARFAIGRLRNLMGLREAPKLGAVRAFGATRDGLLQSGAEMVRQGVLSSPDDIFFLLLDDLRAMAAGTRRDWRTLVAERRRLHARETRRRIVPRLMMSDGTAFYEGVSSPEPGLRGGAGGDRGARMLGSAVSPGVAEGPVRVVRDPREASLAPGEILVCVGTDPAWTPLFLAAAGLVMEVGGLMTHGSVVAREYGIPAVVGVDRATTRLRTGQQVRVDGNNGVVTLLST